MEIVKQIHKINESFDLKPKNPDVKFPVSTFEWRVIMELVEKADKMFNLNIPKLDSWNYNNGDGLETQEECNKLADALDKIVVNQPYNMTVRRQVFPSHTDDILGNTLKKQYKTDIGTVHKFIQFLRQCGGFEIW